MGEIGPVARVDDSDPFGSAEGSLALFSPSAGKLGVAIAWDGVAFGVVVGAVVAGVILGVSEPWSCPQAIKKKRVTITRGASFNPKSPLCGAPTP